VDKKTVWLKILNAIKKTTRSRDAYESKARNYKLRTTQAMVIHTATKMSFRSSHEKDGTIDDSYDRRKETKKKQLADGRRGEQAQKKLEFDSKGRKQLVKRAGI